MTEFQQLYAKFTSERCGFTLPNLHLSGRVDVVAEDDETSDSARTSTFFVSVHNLFSRVSAAAKSINWQSFQNVFVQQTPEHG
jgi:hypothetical protein